MPNVANLPAQRFTFPQDVALLVVSPAKKTMFAWVAILLTGRIEDEVTSARGANEKDRVRGCYGARV